MTKPNRREGRRLAMIAMYSIECTAYPVANTLRLMREIKPDWAVIPEFAVQLCEAVETHQQEIERDISSVLEHWKMGRVSPIERAILKLGCAEILYLPDIPPKVTINEYIELAKKYANEHAPAFINGVLYKLAHLAQKADFEAPKKT